MRSRKRTIGVLILVIVVLIGNISGILIYKFNHKYEEENIYSEDVYSYVDNIIKDTVSSGNYLNADIDEKYRIIKKTLNSLEKDNRILKNTVEYDNENKMFWYNYSDGVEGGIMLENFSEGYSGNANIDNYVVRKDEQGKILSYNCDIDFNSNEYPYTAKEVESLDLKAKFMYGLGYDYILDEYKKYQKLWTKQCLKTDIDDYCTVEDFKSGLSGYNIVFIEEHGCYSNKKIMICTEELTSKKSDSTYKADLKDKRIKKVINAEDNKQYYWIDPSFFSFYYKNNELSNTIIWIGSCHGYQCDDLVNAFSCCGVKAVIGYDESVLTGYDCCMLNSFVYSLFYGDSVSEALNFAKSVFGKDDLEYWRTYRGTKSKFGTIALMPSGKNNCATAKLYPGSENARLINAEIIGAKRGAEIKAKTQSSEFVEITEAITTTITTPTTTESTTAIPKEASTYNGHSYMVYPESMTWQEAKEYCEKLGGHLVTISDADEQKFVEELAENCTDKVSYWLGGYYSDAEWKWVDDTKFSYTNWDSWTDGTKEYRQPDNFYGDEFYLRLSNQDMKYENWQSNQGKWNDIANEADGTNGDVPLDSFGVICEWDSISKNNNTETEATVSVDNVTYLEEISITESDRYTGNEGDSFVYPIGKHKNTRGNTCIDGESYEHGIECWLARWNYEYESSWAYSIFHLDKKYSILRGECHIIQSYNTNDFDVTLEFLGDNALLNSYHLTPDSMPIEIDVNISNCADLKIYIYDNEKQKGGTSFGLVDMKLQK